jgi:hypothetical protein
MECQRLRGGEQFLGRGVATILLGPELCEAARSEGQVRSRRSLHRASRCGQRALERRRLHATELSALHRGEDPVQDLRGP